MYYDFIVSGIVVLFLCGLAIMLDLLLKRKYSHYLLGVMFGLITIFVMCSSKIGIQSSSLDFRHITMTMAGFIGGPVTALIAAIISAAYRYSLGGSGAMGGIIIIIVFGCFGTVLGKNIRNKQNGKKFILWFFIGIIMSVMLLLIIRCFPPQAKHAQAIQRIVSGPYFIITPLATTVIFNFYYRVYEYFSKASILNAIINSSPINIMIFDSNGSIMVSQNIKNKLKADPFIENLLPFLRHDKTWLGTQPQHREITTEDGKHFVADVSSFEMPSGENAFLAIVNDATDLKMEQERLRAANEKFHKVFQLGPHMMAIIRKSDYKFVDVNRRYLEAKGFEYEDVIGKTPRETGTSESHYKEFIQAVEERRSVNNIECSLVTKYGSTVTVIVSAETIYIDDQECYLIAYNDITEMKRMQTERLEQLTKNLELEADLAKSNQLIADIINNMPDGFYALDNQLCFMFVNKMAEELFQKTREEIIGRDLWSIDPQAQGTLIELNLQKARSGCLPITFEYLGSLHIDSWHQITAYPSESGMCVYYRDITEQKLASEKLIKSQEETISILESMTDCFYAMDQDLQFTYINRAAEIAFRKSREELLGRKMTEVFKANDTALLHYNRVISEKRSVTFETISKALGDKWLELSVYPTETGVACYFRDITERKLAEETLRQSEEKFSKAFHGGPIMMMMATIEEGKFIDINEALCSRTGYTREEIIDHTSKELNFFVDSDKRETLKKLLIKQSKIENAEFDFHTKSGEIRQGLSWSQLFYLNGQQCHITGLIDITEQKLIQKEMAKLDRLNLIGQLSAGIAHEIRNPMTTVRGYLQLLGVKPEFAAKKPTFELMISELDRANAIITEFLSLAQTKQAEMQLINVNDILNHLYPLLEADTFTRNKQIRFIPGDTPNIELNEKEITQLVLNLTRNGLEVMKERGLLTIRSYIENNKVVLSIADEGCGIPPENLDKLGTPFFTTKDDGIGLGLAICYKIAESHNAKINIDSSPSGTTFFVIFPIPDNSREK